MKSPPIIFLLGPPALVARYRRNLDGFAGFLRERGELPNEDG